ncbi:hypothetical protein [Actinopolyspora mortivallis]|uniref:DUF2207 domain-containing protein n=1 Tax=Actinopolyspora mortivallis TaxID=33906 RepID=A0A2T0GSG1_ACTMO|nr:hypothetical protein [Actinopolyspora mortivallis]PRW62052.1 hypothetical protein CEP50_17585 [Actinopolyspora mortivallis]
MWWKVVLGLLALWLVITVGGAIIGFVIKGLFWIAVLGGVLFLATAAVGWAKKDNRQLRDGPR